MALAREIKPVHLVVLLTTAAASFCLGFTAQSAIGTDVGRTFLAISAIRATVSPTQSVSPTHRPSQTQIPSPTQSLSSTSTASTTTSGSPTQTTSHFPPGVVCASAREGWTEVVTIKVACVEGVIESLPFVFYGSPVGSCADGGFVVDSPICADPSFPSYAVSRCVGYSCCWLSTRSRPDPCAGKVLWDGTGQS